MAAHRYAGPLGSNTNRPRIDTGTNCRSRSPQPGSLDAESRPEPIAQLRSDPVSPLQSGLRALGDWASQLDEAIQMGTWWLIGSPSLGMPNGDLEFGPGDKETEHMKNTPAYQEAVQIYRDWVNHGRPAGKFSVSGTDCEWVPSKGYFYVVGRSGAAGPRGNWKEPLLNPLWGLHG